jgi:hypothetical protein
MKFVESVMFLLRNAKPAAEVLQKSKIAIIIFKTSS